MRVLLCDDHPVYRDGLRMLLEELGVEVVGEAADGETAVRMVAELRPDVVVMDLHMPGIGGVEATLRITREHPAVGVLVLTMIEDDATLFAALRSGARGYLLKGSGHADVHRALEAVARGDAVLAAPVAERLRYGLSTASASQAFPELSRRELEVLELVARGRDNGQIARTLFISLKTVRNNVSAIFTKLGVASRAEAVARARDAGLGS